MINVEKLYRLKELSAVPFYRIVDVAARKGLFDHHGDVHLYTGKPSHRSILVITPRSIEQRIKGQFSDIEIAGNGKGISNLRVQLTHICLLYTSDAADDLLCV